MSEKTPDLRERYANRTRLAGLPMPAKYRLREDGLYVIDQFPGVADMSDNQENAVPVVERPKLIDALNPPAWLKITLGILAVLAASLIGAAEMGIALPALLISIAKVVSAILVGLGITSAGVSTPEKK